MVMKLLAMVSIVMLAGSLVVSKPRQPKRLALGTWGGMHIRIEVGPRTATVDYDCANGTITGPLTMDSKGVFSWRGFFKRERPGPMRQDDTDAQQPAVYTGSIKGDTMKLTVRLAGSNEDLDTFTLKRGSAGKVFKCM